MGEVNYSPIIKDMTWSYSRIKSFYDCPYKWYLRYIRRLKGKDMFFSSYGTFMHKLIEMYMKNEKNPRQLCEIYLRDFKKEVHGSAPSQKIFVNYFRSGLEYLKSLKPLPYNTVAVEKKVDFKIDDIPFIGYIDLLGEKDGELFIIDNKSRNLKPRSSRKKPTKSDEELDEYLKQLYLYSAAVEQEYGVLPKELCFNCYRSQTLIKEPFCKQKYDESKAWLSEKVAEIENESDFNPEIEFFKCRYLCEMQDYCEYYSLSQRR